LLARCGPSAVGEAHTDAQAFVRTGERRHEPRERRRLAGAAQEQEPELHTGRVGLERVEHDHGVVRAAQHDAQRHEPR
jgi:hypothetical protein